MGRFLKHLGIFKYIVISGFLVSLLGLLILWVIFVRFSSQLPPIITVEDYTPLKVTEVFDRNNAKIGEFLIEKRSVIETEILPEFVFQAFIAAEDAEFYNHSGINFQAIFRAVIANLRAGRTVQGGSTITQQVAKQILLTSERSYSRKIKEAILARRMERDLSKKDILYLYLNQIYFGQSAYGIEMASQVYFKKPAEELKLHEAAMLAGLPKAPSAFSPVKNPSRSKMRQKYVLNRMAEEGFITKIQKEEYIAKSLKVFFKEDYQEIAPFFMEAVRLLLIKEIGEEQVLNRGLKVITSLDLKKHIAAQKSLKQGIKDLDKRQGFRGAHRNLKTEPDVLNFLAHQKEILLQKKTPFIIIDQDGRIVQKGEVPINETHSLIFKDIHSGKLPDYIEMEEEIKGVVSRVDDENLFVEVQVPEAIGLIDFQTMKWARSPDPSMAAKYAEIKKPSEALSPGDVITVKIKKTKIATEAFKALKHQVRKKHFPRKSYVELELEQKPLADGSLISIDQVTQEIVAMVGGYDFKKSEYNKAIQSARQTGSSFKPIVYAAALDKGFQPNSEILDIPIIFKEEDKEKSTKDQVVYSKYKPTNHSKSFGGDILFRDALVRSLNIPTIRITDSISVDWVLNYAQRLGIFSPLNKDITLSLGSSGVTLYEMTKMYSQFGRLGKQTRPIIIKKVENEEGDVLLENYTLDKRFEEEIIATTQQWQERVIEKQTFGDVKPYFIFEDNEEQLIKPQTAYIMTNILQGVIEDRHGTGRRAQKIIPHPIAGKTGTTDNYYDAWFVGYSPLIATGVWIGFEKERSLGRGEVGGRSALPIWARYMKEAHKNLPFTDFPIPEGIVFAEIDGRDGKLATELSERKFKQAFEEGQQPEEKSNANDLLDEKEFLKEDLSG